MKTCSKDGCDYPSFSKGYCRRHQYLRMDKSVPTLRKSRVDPKKLLKSPIKRKPTGEKALFDALIATRPHKSVLTGKRIYNIGPANCAHLWSKKQKPEFRLLDINICFLTFEEHHLFDQGTEAQRKKYAEENNCDWSILDELKAKVIQTS